MSAILHRPGEGCSFGIGPGPPLHVHHVVTETWYILEGTVTFVAEGQTIEATPGTTLYVPTGVPHTFVNSGAGIARWIGIFSPGRFSKMLEDIGGAITPAGPDPERMSKVFDDWDTKIVEE